MLSSHSWVRVRGEFAVRVMKLWLVSPSRFKIRIPNCAVSFRWSGSRVLEISHKKSVFIEFCCLYLLQLPLMLNAVVSYAVSNYRWWGRDFVFSGILQEQESDAAKTSSLHLISKCLHSKSYYQVGQLLLNLGGPRLQCPNICQLYLIYSISVYLLSHSFFFFFFLEEQLEDLERFNVGLVSAL